MSAITEFLFPAPARRTAGSIFGWWEKRRLVYNVAVGAAGLVSLGTGIALSFVFGDVSGGPPLLLPIAFGVMANVCYFLGPIAEITIDKLFGRDVLPTGPALYRMGLTFSVGLALFPTLLFLFMAVARVVAGIFF